MDYEAVLQAMEENLASTTWRVSGKLSILQSGVVHPFHSELLIVPHITKILQNFRLTLP